MKSNVIGWSDAKYRSWIVSLLRKGTLRYPPRNEVLREARTEKKINPSSGRLAQHYKCAECGGEFPMSAVQVNHKEPVIGEEGFISWDKYIERMFCAKENFEVLCKSCHEVVTQKEASRRRELKTSSEQRTNQCYKDMKDRCYNVRSQRYHTHGGRGIKVCDRWLESYENFVSDMGIKPDGYSLDRIDNDGDYSPDNCRWATPKEQALNRRTNVYITYNGDTLTISQWAEILGISFNALCKRLARWTIEEALSSERKDVHEIDEDTKEEILARYFEGGISQSKLAKEYGVSQGVISKWVVQIKEENKYDYKN